MLPIGPWKTKNGRQLNFHRGDQVVFEHQLLQPHFGTIARINRQTVTVHTDDGKTWRVSFALLRRIVEV